ncbi:MAG: sensor histidine kinase [Acidobacteriota bacterium]
MITSTNVKVSGIKPNQNKKLAQALSTYVLKAQEEERMRLAREMHDELGQSLTSIKLGLELLLTTIDHTDINKTKKILTDVCSCAEATSKEVQRIARDLRPSVLDDFGLAVALEAYSQSYSKRTGIKVKVSLEPLSIKLLKDAEIALYRIVQEALTNTAKHSGAKNISIDLVEQANTIILTIIDDGKGCQLHKQSSRQNRGFGLLGMSERARIAGGRLILKSQPGAGFCIQVALPIKEMKKILVERRKV